MATFEQYMQAARNAHSAGDVESARRLVALAKASQNSSVVATMGEGRFVKDGSGAIYYTSPGYSVRNPEKVKRLMGGDGVKQVVQSGFDQQTIDQHPIAARVNEFNRGTPFVGSYLDEVVGLASPAARDAMRATSDAMRRENPGETMALNMAGGIGYTAPLAVAGASVAKPFAQIAPKTSAGRMLAGGFMGSAAGGSEGLIYGYGEGEALDDRRRMAAGHGEIGSAFGAGFGFVAPLAGSIFRNVALHWKQRDVATIAKKFGVSNDTAKVLKTAFENNDKNAFENIMRAGSEATIADAGRSGQALLDAAAQTGGRALNMIDTAVTSRANRARGVLDMALDDTLGAYAGPRSTAREVAERTRPARDAAYSAAYDTWVDYATPNGPGSKILDALSRIDAKTVEDAAAIANRRMAWDNIGSPQILVKVADDGSWSFGGELPSVRQLDELKKALNQIDQNARDVFGRSTDGGLVAEQARAIRDLTIDATGGQGGTYAAALKVGGDKVEMDRALEFGVDMLRDTKKTTREVVKEATQNLSDEGREMMKRGLRAHIDETLGKVRAVASDPSGQEAREAMAAIKMLTSKNAREKLQMLLGPAEYNRLAPALDESIASLSMRASVARNSATAIRQSIQGQVDDIMEPGAVGRLKHGEIVDATKALTQTLLNTTKADDAAKTGQIWAEVASVLTERRGNKSAAAALKYVERAMAGQPLKEAEAALIAREVVVGLPLLSSRVGNQLLSTP